MDAAPAFATLLHVLVFVYWLGGDLGAFYASSLLTDPARPVPARATAATVLSNIDMAPRTALILAAPTGLQLAALKGWLALDAVALVVVWAASLVWLALAWAIHLQHAPPGSSMRSVDLGVRWLAMVALVTAAAMLADAPLFLRLKLAILAAAIACGLFIRLTLKPFGPAFATVLATGPTPETDAVLARSIAHARPGVLLIWALLIAAAWLGIATPTSMEIT